MNTQQGSLRMDSRSRQSPVLPGSPVAYPPTTLITAEIVIKPAAAITLSSWHCCVANTERSRLVGAVTESDAVQEMEVWPSGVALRGETSNHLKVR
jgi:hypothetical protein